MPKKKKKNEIVEDLKFPLMFAGGAIGASVLGGAVEPHIPHGMRIVFKQLKRTKKKVKGG